MNWIKKLFEPIDMTTGKPWEKIMLFMVPMLIGNIAQQLYNTVDSVIVGRYLGDNALAAVGSAGPVLNLLIVMFVGIGMGASIVVSQYVGAKKREELAKTIGTCLVVTAIGVVIVIILAFIITKPMLVLLHTPEAILDWCHTYLLIMTVGCFGMAYYNILSGILRGLGDSISALVYLIVASISNIFLDLLFVAKFNMGVAGVAYATLISQSFSAVLCLIKLCNMKELFELKLSHVRLDRKYVRSIVSLGIPTGATQAILSMAMIVVQSLTNSFGEAFIAANVIVMRVDGFAVLPALSFGTAMTTYAGQNVGAGSYERTEKGAVQGTFMCLGISAVITGIILIFGRGLMGIFTSTPELVDLSMKLMQILAVGYLALGITQCLSGVMRGAGDTMTPMWISLICTIVIRVSLAYIMVYQSRTPELPLGKKEYVFVSLLISWLAGAVITYIAYKRGKWKTKAVK